MAVDGDGDVSMGMGELDALDALALPELSPSPKKKRKGYFAVDEEPAEADDEDCLHSFHAEQLRVVKPFNLRTEMDIFYTALAEDAPQANFLRTERPRNRKKARQTPDMERGQILNDLWSPSGPTQSLQGRIRSYMEFHLDAATKGDVASKQTEVFFSLLSKQAGVSIRTLRVLGNHTLKKLSKEYYHRWRFLISLRLHHAANRCSVTIAPKP